MMRHDCSKGDLGYMGLLSDLNLNINDFPGNPTSNHIPSSLSHDSFSDLKQHFSNDILALFVGQSVKNENDMSLLSLWRRLRRRISRKIVYVQIQV